MKSLRTSASIVILTAGMFAANPLARAADATQPSPAAAPATTQPVDPRVADAIRKIQTAPDASSVVETYAQARAIAPDSVAVGQAYVSRLVSLGLPEMAESQARDLTSRAPDDGLAWAVVAYADARHDSMRAALEEIAIAAKKLPNDGFVQRTAAQLLAYHDRRINDVSYPESLENSLADMRNALTGKPEFDSTFRVSSQVYAQGPTTGPVTIGRYTYNPPTDAYDSGGPRVTYDDNYGGYSEPAYTNQYLYVVPSYGYFSSPFYFHSGFHDHFDHFRHDDFHDHFIHGGFHDGFHDGGHDGFHDGAHDGFHDGFSHSNFGHDFNRGGNFGSRDSGTIDRGQRYIGGGVNTHVGGSGMHDGGMRGGGTGGGGTGGGGFSGGHGGGGGGHR
jgi:hypothetical protein